MPHTSPSVAQDRRRGRPKYPQDGGAIVQRLLQSGRAPAPGELADGRIASLGAASSLGTNCNLVGKRLASPRSTRAARPAPNSPFSPFQCELAGHHRQSNSRKRSENYQASRQKAKSRPSSKMRDRGSRDGVGARAGIMRHWLRQLQRAELRIWPYLLRSPAPLQRGVLDTSEPVPYAAPSP